MSATTATELELAEFELAEAPRALLRPAPPREGWFPAVVPGGVHESLIAAGRIENPYRDEVESEIGWIEKRDWWYRTSFSADPMAVGERARLVFEGLDTMVEIWLNGELLGRHRNMFRPAEFDVTGRLRAQNELVLRFAPPLARLGVPLSSLRLVAKLLSPKSPFAAGGNASALPMTLLARAVARRKATFSWGWDFAPRVPSIGVWRPVRLVRERQAALRGVRADTLAVDAVERTALVQIDLDVERLDSGAPLTAIARLTAPDGTVVELPLADRGDTFTVRHLVRDARLWWTHDLGEPELYDLAVELREGGTLLGERRIRMGLRTIELDRSADPEGGRHFGFVLNGFPVFARGANWIPNSLMLGSIDPGLVRDRVRRAQEGGMNMLRVWGGGIMEQEAFYAACDEAGVLVWQDFLFACIDYPSGRRSLKAEVRAEAEHQVRALGSHPSLALWCGNNEAEMVHATIFQNAEPGGWGWHFYHQILPDTVRRWGGSVPYWPGSPWGEDRAQGWRAINGVLDGDRHAWEVWHGLDFGAGEWKSDLPGGERLYRRFEADRGKFISEFGIHASPVLPTLEKWTRPGSLAIHSSAFDHRNKDAPKDKHDPILNLVTGIPQTLREYADFTMASQAEALKFAVEHYRRRQPHCRGALVWQFNDAWPGFSWSVVDYEGAPKAGYYACRRVFDPVVASLREDGAGNVELWVSNAGRERFTDDVTVTVESLAGAPLFSHTARARVGPFESNLVWSGPVEAGRDRVALVTGSRIRRNRLFFGEIKDLELPAATLTVRREAGRIAVRASAFAYAVQLLPANPLARFSDNFRDIRADEEAVFTVADCPVDDVRVLGYAGQSVEIIES